MTNSYEVAEIVEIGGAVEWILGQKPVGTMDSVAELCYFFDETMIDVEEANESTGPLPSILPP